MHSIYDPSSSSSAETGIVFIQFCLFYALFFMLLYDLICVCDYFCFFFYFLQLPTLQLPYTRTCFLTSWEFLSSSCVRVCVSCQRTLLFFVTHLSPLWLECFVCWIFIYNFLLLLLLCMPLKTVKRKKSSREIERERARERG